MQVYNKLLLLFLLLMLTGYLLVNGLFEALYRPYPYGLIWAVFLLLLLIGGGLALKWFLSKKLYWVNATLGAMGIVFIVAIIEAIAVFISGHPK